MSETFEYGPPDTYEIQWASGHVEQIQAHQVQLPSQGLAIFAGAGLGFGPGQVDRRVVTIHAEINGRWKLVLHAPEDDIRSIRLVTVPESIPDGAS